MKPTSACGVDSPSLWFLALSSPSHPVLPSCFFLDWPLCNGTCRCSFGVSGGRRGASSYLSCLLAFRTISLWVREGESDPVLVEGWGSGKSMTGPG